MKDTGLLIAMLEDGSQLEVIQGSLGIYKGAIIDFFIRYENKATAIEVKSADNTKSKSLNSVIDNWNVEKGIRLSSKNIGTNSGNEKNNLYSSLYDYVFIEP